MFFMLGTWPGKKDLGLINGYHIYMVYESLIFFFIPVFKFGKRYLAEKNGSIYELDPETGKAIERGEEVNLNITGDPVYTDPNASIAARAGLTAAGTPGAAGTDGAFGTSGTEAATGKICMRCGFKTDNETYTHCPMCGNKLVHE